jgi:PAS domain S-box-containing protein
MLYEFAPSGCLTIDRTTAMRELNHAASRMLGADRQQLVGQNLAAFLAPQSAHALQSMLGRLRDGADTVVEALQLVTGEGAARWVQAAANRDPDGQQFLIAFIDVASDANADSF